jgi:hypothetical protein
MHYIRCHFGTQDCPVSPESRKSGPLPETERMNAYSVDNIPFSVHYCGNLSCDIHSLKVYPFRVKECA